jgi:hypothetical protein
LILEHGNEEREQAIGEATESSTMAVAGLSDSMIVFSAALIKLYADT